jgi:RNA polymerase sigma-70 factor (ECF subfamily)
MRKNLTEIHALQKRICQSSDEAAFASLFRLFYQSLYHFAVQYVHKHEVAEEVVNDVFVKIWKQRATLLEVQNLESYLFIAVKNGSLNYLKQYSHYHIAIDDENTGKLISLHNPEQDIEWKELYFRLQQAVNNLPNQCRVVFRLVKEEGFRMKEVAEILGISPRTVETQLYRAIKRLDSILNEQYKPKKNNQDKLVSIVIFILTSLMAGLQ